MKKNFIFLCLMISLGLSAQEPIVESKSSIISLGLDVQSRYIWRGLQLGGNSPSLQPAIKVALSDKFAVGAWGAYSIGGKNTKQETDLYVSYLLSSLFSITVTDYYFPTEGGGYKYFDYGRKTGHVFEAMLSFSGIRSFPVGITVATNFGGAIKYTEKNTSNEKSAYSTYVEVNYSRKTVGVEYSVFAGAVFSDNNRYYSTKGTGLINVGFSATKEIKITEFFNIPVNATLVFNPNQEKIFLTFGFSL